MESTESPATVTAPPTPEPTVRLEPFSVDHAREVIGKHQWPGAVEALVRGPAVTLRHVNGSLLGCIGLLFPTPWAAEMWLLATPAAAEHADECFSHVQSILQEFAAGYGPHRISTFADPKDTVRLEWLSRLGFTKEGTVRQIGPLGENFDIYSWLPIVVPANGEGQ